MKKRAVDSSGGLLYVIVVVILAGLAANIFLTPTRDAAEVYQPDNVSQGFEPRNNVRFGPEPCDVTQRPEQTMADFTATIKESPGAIGPASVLHRGDPQSHANAVIRSVICGNTERGGNRLVLEGILTALRDGHPQHLSYDEWVRTADTLMTAAWLPQYTNIVCRAEKPGTKTVYGQRGGGKLRLGVTTIRAERQSCYVGLVFKSLDAGRPLPQVVRLRLPCFFQATTFRGAQGKQLWHVPFQG